MDWSDCDWEGIQLGRSLMDCCWCNGPASRMVFAYLFAFAGQFSRPKLVLQTLWCKRTHCERKKSELVFNWDEHWSIEKSKSLWMPYLWMLVYCSSLWGIIVKIEANLWLDSVWLKFRFCSVIYWFGAKGWEIGNGNMGLHSFFSHDRLIRKWTCDWVRVWNWFALGEILGVQNSGLGMKACAQNEREINLGSFVSTWNERGEIRVSSSWNEPRSCVRVFMLGL